MSWPSVLAVAVVVMLGAGTGCGGDGSSEISGPLRVCEGKSSGERPRTDADAARKAAVDYLLTCDPDACTEDATPNHVRVDYGTLARCETVRKSNRLTRDSFSLADRAEVDGTEATLRGTVRSTGQTFVVELKKVAGSWKVDRLRGAA